MSKVDVARAKEARERVERGRIKTGAGHVGPEATVGL